MKRLMMAALLVWLGCGKKNESSETPTSKAQPTAQKEPAATPDTKPATKPDEKPATKPASKVEPDEPDVTDEPAPTILGVAKPGEKLSKTSELKLANVTVTVKVASDGKAASASLRSTGKWDEHGPFELKVPHQFEAIVDGGDLYVLALQLDPKGAVTWTNASRYRLDKRKRLVAAGGFEGEGRVDYQTIDLDEE